jgi:YVTN family beta-propeller protein
MRWNRSGAAIPVFLFALAGCAGWEYASDVKSYEVWVTNQATNKIQIIEGKTLKVIAEIAGGTRPHNITFSPDFKIAYVANVGSGDVTVVDAAARKVIGTIPSGKRAHHVAVSPDGRWLYVCNPGDDNVVVADAKTLKVVKKLDVEKAPAMSAFSPDGKKAYVSNGGTFSVSVIDVASGEVLKSIQKVAAGEIMGQVMSPDGSRLFVTSGATNRYVVIDPRTDTVLATVQYGKDAHGAALTVDGRYVVIPNRQSNDLTIADAETGQIAMTIPNIGDKPDIIDVAPDGRFAFASLRGRAVTGDPDLVSGKEPGVAVVDLYYKRRHAHIPLGGDPHGIAVRPL